MMHARIIVISVFCTVVLAGCGAAPAPSPTPTPSQPTVAVTATLTAAQAEIQGLWRKGPHSKVRIPAEALDYSCAQCHSPGEWDPQQAPVKAADCAASIVDPQAGPSNVNVDTASWHGVDCRNCHRALEEGGFSAELAYWNPESGSYEAVKDSRELCEKCHKKSAGIDNRIDMGAGFHAGLVCTDCHEPHRGAATCANAACHANLVDEIKILDELTMPPGHETDAPHACGGGQCHPAATQVAQAGSLRHIGIEHGYMTCSACHDASGMQVGPEGPALAWNTWQTVTWGGAEGKRPLFSHNLQKAVDCSRCHFAGNPWRLSVLSTEGP